MTVPATQAQIEALELIDTFAWSCVKTDCEESRIELQRRINECRAALTAAPKADVRFREFGGGATWVDFPMTQDSAQTEPTQAQIEAVWNEMSPQLKILIAKAFNHALTAAAEAGEHGYTQSQLADPKDGPTQAQIEAAAKIIQQNVNNVPLDYAEIVARRALTAAAEAGEHGYTQSQLADPKDGPTQAQIDAAIEAFSKSAGYPIDARIADGSMLRANLVAALTAAAETTSHNESITNASMSVGPTDGPTFSSAAAEAGEPYCNITAAAHQYVQDELKLVEAATIERCAQVADRLANKYRNSIAIDVVAALEEAAAAIRAMKGQL